MTISPRRASTVAIEREIAGRDWPQRVLVVHNKYQYSGGEDRVVEAEVGLLRARGHDVRVFEDDNVRIPELGRFRLAANTIWSVATQRSFHASYITFRPQIVHVHNTLPLISPSIYWAASKERIPVIQTLHNFRLACLNGMFLRQGRTCEDCLGKLPWRGVVRRCYRDSFGASGAVALMLAVHRGLGTWRTRVDRYVALSEFSRQKLIRSGLSPQSVTVKPNFANVAPPVPAERSGFLFAGRLSPEKGIAVMAAAAGSLRDTVLDVAGEGPLKGLLSGLRSVRLLGAIPHDEVLSRMGRSVALVLPTLTYENSPLSVIEAFGRGLPVIASRIGALEEMVEDGATGLLFQPGDPAELASRLNWATEHPERMASMGRLARIRFEQAYGPDENYKLLLDIYRSAYTSSRQPEV